MFRTEKKGFGIKADQDIFADQFIIEYVGEVLNNKQFEKRAKQYSLDKNVHYYFMALRSNAIIDATTKGDFYKFFVSFIIIKFSSVSQVTLADSSITLATPMQ